MDLRILNSAEDTVSIYLLSAQDLKLLPMWGNLLCIVLAATSASPPMAVRVWTTD